MQIPIQRPLSFKWVTGIVIVVLLLIVIIFWQLTIRVSTTAFHSADAQIALRYDARLHAPALGSQDRKDKVVLRLTNTKDQPELLITLRYETGLKPIATATKQPLREALATNITKTYPQRFPHFM